MSLTINQLLKPREIIESYIADFEAVLENIDEDAIFHRVIKMEIEKRILMNAIYSKKPVNLIFVGSPGCGKTLLIESVYNAFKYISLLVHSQTSSGIGTMESILLVGKKLRFLCVDELEKFDVVDRQAFLSLMSEGTISRRLANRNVYEEGFKVYMFATCNNILKIQKEQPEFMDRCSIINVPSLGFSDYLYITSKRLLMEPGIRSEEIARYIGSTVYHNFGATNMRLAVRLANFAEAHMTRTKQPEVTKDIIDSVASDFKAVELKL